MTNNLMLLNIVDLFILTDLKFDMGESAGFYAISKRTRLSYCLYKLIWTERYLNPTSMEKQIHSENFNRFRSFMYLIRNGNEKWNFLSN